MHKVVHIELSNEEAKTMIDYFDLQYDHHSLEIEFDEFMTANIERHCRPIREKWPWFSAS